MSRWIVAAICSLWVVFLPGQAYSGPLVSAVSAISTWWAGLAPLAQALIRIGAGILLTRATQQTPDQPDLKREFPLPTSLPAKRTVYGHFSTTGTPAPWRVNGNRLYGCILFNSRPASGSNLSLTIDGRECAFAERITGTELTDPVDYADLFDFASDGQLIKIKEKFPDWDAGEEQFIAWLGLGDQTAPPDRILAEVPQFFQATDAWRGRTVLWVSMSAGGSVSKRPKRWPSVPPEIEIEMDWTPVWDPEDPAQDMDDPDTWTFSDNQARCLLDAARFNPVRAYAADQLILDTFTAAVPLADENVLLWHASQDAGETVTEPRYRVAGAIDWTKGELLDLLKPLADAGAGELATVGGRLSYLPGAYEVPVYTMTDVLADKGVEFTRLGSRRDVPYALKGSWTSQERGYETAELDPVPVTGGSTRLDDVQTYPLPLVPSGYQAQRVTQIMARRLAAQKRLSCVLPPSAIKLIPGSGVTGALPAPFGRLNGIWQVADADPGVWLRDGENGKVAFRIPVTLRENAASIYAWDPESDEVEVRSEDLSGEDVDLGAVQNLTAHTVEIDSGGAVVLMIEYSFDAITDYVVDNYSVWWKLSEDADYIPLPDIMAGAVGGNIVTGQFGPVQFGQSYDLRVVANGPTSQGLYSYVLGVVAGLQVAGAAATPGTGSMTVTGTAPTSGYFGGLRLYRAAVGEAFSESIQVGGDIVVPSGSAFSVVFGRQVSADLVTGGDFSDAADWTVNTGWAVSGGVATHASGSVDAEISQTLLLSAGEVYQVTLTVSGLSGTGNAHVKLSGNADPGGAELTTNGIFVTTIIAGAAADGVAVYADALRGITVDDLSVALVIADDLPGGEADWWVVPYTSTGLNGTPTALGTKTVT